MSKKDEEAIRAIEQITTNSFKAIDLLVDYLAKDHDIRRELMRKVDEYMANTRDVVSEQIKKFKTD